MGGLRKIEKAMVNRPASVTSLYPSANGIR